MTISPTARCYHYVVTVVTPKGESPESQEVMAIPSPYLLAMTYRTGRRGRWRIQFAHRNYARQRRQYLRRRYGQSFDPEIRQDREISGALGRRAVLAGRQLLLPARIGGRAGRRCLCRRQRQQSRAEIRSRRQRACRPGENSDLPGEAPTWASSMCPGASRRIRKAISTFPTRATPAFKNSKPTGTPLLKWGRDGSFDGAFFFPRGVAVDFVGNIYVADESNNRIQKFDARGSFLTKWGREGGGPGQFKSPWGIACDALGNVYVVDTRQPPHPKVRRQRHVPLRLGQPRQNGRPIEFSLRDRRRQRRRASMSSTAATTAS